jgi:hypothetical protein
MHGPDPTPDSPSNDATAVRDPKRVESKSTSAAASVLFPTDVSSARP